MKKLLPIAVVLFSTLSAFAQLAQLTNETNPSGIIGAKPTSLTKLGNKIIFLASTTQFGKELWITDGTDAGTTLLKDIRSGATDLSISPFAVMNNKAYFCAQLDIGFQLWVTDGTSAGTKPVMIKTFAQMFTPVSNGTQLFFVDSKANILNASTTMDLWKSDGTESGTVIVVSDFPSSNTANLSFYNGLLIFSAVDPNDITTKVWRSDGTEEGTFPFISGFDGDGSGPGGTSHPSRFIEYNGKLYFVIRDNNHFDPSVGLVQTDATVEGTVYLKSLYAGNNDLIEYGEAIAYNDKIYLSFYDADLFRFFIYESDGTEANTGIIYDHTAAAYFNPSPMFTRDNYLFFTDGVDSGTGVTLTRLDLSDNSTTVIKKLVDVATKPNFFQPRYVDILAGPGDGNFLIGVSANSTSSSTWTLWTSDGTTANTTLLNKTTTSSATVVTSDRVYSSAKTTADGEQLWSFGASAIQLKIANTGETGAASKEMVVNNGKLLSLTRNNDVGYEPWTTDGTIAGSHMITDLNPGTTSSTPRQIVPFGDEFAFLGFLGTNGSDWTIMKTDATEAGTSQIYKFIYPEYASNMYANSDHTSIYISQQVQVSGQIRYRLSHLNQNETAPTELVTLGTDGTVFPLSVNEFENAGSKAFFLVKGPFGGGGLWTTDGTAGGTKSLAAHFSSSELTIVGNTVYYLAYTDVNDKAPDLMMSDGTEEGTIIRRSLETIGIRLASSLTAFGNKLVFAGISEEKGKELYISDGTMEGTKLLKDLFAGPSSGFRSTSIEVLGNAFYFAGDNGTTGIELYKSDGTSEGTTLVKDIYEGSESSAPQSLKVLNGKLYFSARTAESGMEIWSTDGTTDNTKLFIDVVPGTLSSNPTGFVSLNDYLIFSALTGDDGRQYYSFKPAPEQPGETTGLEDERSPFTVYPNPSTGLFYIKSDVQNPVVEVYSSDGRRLHRGAAGENQSIDLQGASPGIYIIRVMNNMKTYSAKVLKR